MKEACFAGQCDCLCNICEEPIADRHRGWSRGNPPVICASDECFKARRDDQSATGRNKRRKAIRGRVCRICEVRDETQRSWSRCTSLCGACEASAQRHGLSTCCGKLTVRAPSRSRYCPLCPGPGKVSVVMVSPSGEERETFHPADAVGARSAVVTAGSERSWSIGSLQGSHMRDVKSTDLGQPRREVKIPELARRAQLGLPLFTGAVAPLFRQSVLFKVVRGTA